MYRTVANADCSYYQLLLAAVTVWKRKTVVRKLLVHVLAAQS